MIKADADTDYAKIRPVLDRASKAKLKGVALAAEQIKNK
jgi:biopolymer transport protein ExbD